MARIFGDRWKIERQIAIGGQAFIYLVKDIKTQDDKNYILKKLKNPKRIGRFEKEIEALTIIRSKYISEIIDYKISEKGFSYYVMSFYSEKTLNYILKELKDNFIRCLKIFEKICKGIKEAHEYEFPIIHRDLKPDNILIDENDNPKIIDFGLCYFEGEERLTLSMEQVGSRFYIAPECEKGKSEDIGSHTDVYSLGKILYAMASGGEIFPRERQNEVEYNLMKISRNRQAKFIMEIINKCVKEETSDRIANVKDLILLTEKIIELLEIGCLPVNYGNDFCRFCGRGKLVNLGKLLSCGIKDNITIKNVEDLGLHLWTCNYCGHVHFFVNKIYEDHS